MHSVHPATRRIGGLASFALVGVALVGVAAVPVGAQTATTPSTTSTQSACPAGPPVLELANPNPGDLLPTGDIFIFGTAFDPGATSGTGIGHIDLFLGNRDLGGTFLGTATPGKASTSAFQVDAKIPNSENGGRDFIAYAYSSLTGAQTSVTVPVNVGAAPTPTPTVANAPLPVALTETIVSSCQATTTIAPPAGAPAAPVVQPLAAVSAVGPVLQLANPSDGDVLLTGDVIIEGQAFDPSAISGSGIDRVELFLDNRDTGGLSIGSGVPGQNGATAHAFRIKATVPANANGGHALFAYAHSSITGQETVVSVPMFVGTPPTPTPRPKSS
jgi:hypothetical protein